jgi:hypothetical protein
MVIKARIQDFQKNGMSDGKDFFRCHKTTKEPLASYKYANGSFGKTYFYYLI